MSIRLRRGTDAERIGVVFDEGEIVYCTDTKSVWTGDGTTVGGNKLVGDELLSVAVVGFENTDVRFFGELGSPVTQGWDEPDDQTTLEQADVFGESKTVVVIPDNDSSKYVTQKTLTDQEWLDTYTYGATFSGTARLDTDDGRLGFFAAMQVNSSANPDPVNTGNRRYAVTLEQDGDYVRVSSPDISGSYTFDESSPITILKDEWFNYVVEVPPLMGDAMLYVNGVLVPYMVEFATNIGGLGTHVVVGSGSSSGADRVSYHDNFGVTVYAEPSDKTLNALDLSRENLYVLIPPGRRDYVLSFPTDLVGRKIGDQLSVDMQNIGGTVTFTNEDPNQPKALINGFATTVFSVPKATGISAINVVDNANTYSYTPVDYRDDVVNEKDFAVSGEVSAGSLSVGDMMYPTVDGNDGESIITDGEGNLRFADVSSSVKVIDVNSQVVSFGEDTPFVELFEVGTNTISDDWNDISSGSATISTLNDNVLGETKSVVQFEDRSTSGVAATNTPLEQFRWDRLYKAGGFATFDYENGQTDDWWHLQINANVSAAMNPDGSNQPKKYSFFLGKDAMGGNAQVKINEETIRFDGTNGKPQLSTNDYHSYRIEIPPNFGDATLYVDDYAVTTLIPFEVSTSDTSEILITTESAPLKRWSRLSEFQFTAYESTIDIALTEDDLLENESVIVVTSDDPFDYNLIFPSTSSVRETGTSVQVLGYNVGGSFTVTSDDTETPVVTFSGDPSRTFVVNGITNAYLTARTIDGVCDYVPSTSELGDLRDVIIQDDLARNDVLMFDGEVWTNIPSVGDAVFDNIDYRFFGELGMPSLQEWEEEATTDTIIDIVTLDVFGESKKVVRLYDDGLGIASLTRPMVAQDFVDINDYGANFSGVMRIDPVDGANGVLAHFGVSAADNPQGNNTASRYAINYSQSGGFATVQFIDTTNGNSSTMTLDGIDQPVVVASGDWFEFEMVIPPNFGAAEMYINGVLLSELATFGENASSTRTTSVFLSSASNSTGDRVTYYDNFGLTVYRTESEVVLTDDMLKTASVGIVIPPGRRDYVIKFPQNAQGRKVGDDIAVTINNVNGHVTFTNDDLDRPSALLQGLATRAYQITKVSTARLINITEGRNNYVISRTITDEDIGVVGGEEAEVAGELVVENMTARPETPNVGDQVFDLTLTPPRPIWWEGAFWVDSEGKIV